MATQLDGTIKRWIGISSDVKPVVGLNPDGTTLAASDLPPGSSFFESDTGTIFRWTGTGWVAPQPDTRIIELLTRILDEAYRERLVQEFGLGVNSDDLVDTNVPVATT